MSLNFIVLFILFSFNCCTNITNQEKLLYQNTNGINWAETDIIGKILILSIPNGKEIIRYGDTEHLRFTPEGDVLATYYSGLLAVAPVYKWKIENTKLTIYDYDLKTIVELILINRENNILLVKRNDYLVKYKVKQ